MSNKQERLEERYFKSLSEAEQRDWIKDVIERMKTAYGVKTYSELAEKLNYSSKSTVNGWLANFRFPFHAVMTCAAENDVSVDMLIFGRRPEFRFDFVVRDRLRSTIVKDLVGASRFDLLSKEGGVDMVADTLVDNVESIITSTLSRRKEHKN